MPSVFSRLFRPLVPLFAVAAVLPVLSASVASSSEADVGDSFVNWAFAIEGRLDAATCTAQKKNPTPNGGAPAAGAAVAAADAGGGSATAAFTPGAVNAVFYGDEVIVKLDGGQTPATVGGIVAGAAEGADVIEFETIVFDFDGAGEHRTVLVNYRLSGEPTGGLLNLIRDLRKNRGVEASPNYALRPADFVYLWPNGEPAAAPGPKTARDASIGADRKIFVLDSGLAPTAPPTNAAEAAALLTDVQPLTPADVENPDANGDGVVDYEHAGHGLAIAGVIKTLAPATQVGVGRMTAANGLASDWTAARRGWEMLTGTPGGVSGWPDVTVMSFGTPACTFQGGYMVPFGLEAIAEALDTVGGGRVLVVAAGNDSTSEPFFPAAFNRDADLRPTVIPVGALDARTDDINPSPWYSASRSGSIAEFANYGHQHIDVWAPGVGLETLHLTGQAWERGGTPLEGWAYVNGSSFAAPYVAALIVEEIERAASVGRVRTPLQAFFSVRFGGGTPVHPCENGATVPLPNELLADTQKDRAVALRNAVSLAITQPKAGATVTC